MILIKRNKIMHIFFNVWCCSERDASVFVYKGFNNLETALVFIEFNTICNYNQPGCQGHVFCIKGLDIKRQQRRIMVLF